MAIYTYLLITVSNTTHYIILPFSSVASLSNVQLPFAESPCPPDTVSTGHLRQDMGVARRFTIPSFLSD